VSVARAAGPARARSGSLLRALLAVTQRAHECLARAGRRQLELEPPALEEDSMRFMTDLAGGGSRAREAARSADPEAQGARSRD
jgi:hypothetical protein